MKIFFQRLGLDAAISYVLAGKLISVLSYASIILLMPHFLSSEAQGYYFTFNSIVALQIFFELGVATVITQFVSHEMSGLRYDFEEKKIVGNANNKQRYFSIIRFSVKWYGVIAGLIIIVVGPIGYKFFSSEGASDINWLVPWIALTITTAINVFFVSIISIAEGCGLVAKVNKVRVVQTSISACLAIIFLVSGNGLFGVASIAIAGCFTYVYFINKYFRKNIKEAWVLTDEDSSLHTPISWKKEIFPMQWRIALSWMSGYFIFFIMTPISFKYFGPIYAGRLGMSMAVCNIIMATGLAWISTKYSRWGTLISSQNRKEFDISYRTSVIQSTGFVLLCFICVGAGLVLFDRLGFAFANRFLSPYYFITLTLAMLGNHLAACLATYIRAHKEEKMTFVTLIMAVITTIALFIVAMNQWYNIYLVTYCVLVWCYLVPISFYMYRRFKGNVSVSV